MNKYSKLLVFSNLVFAILLISLELFIFIKYKNFIPLPLSMLCTAITLVYFGVNTFTAIKNRKLEKANLSLNESKLYNKTLNRLNDDVRCFKHDFGNIMQSIGGYLKLNDLKGLKKYYSELSIDCNNIKNLSILNPNSINNPAIYTLLTSKYYIAEKEGIQFNIYSFLDLNKLNMKVYEFTRILGILLDNAIEAARECDEKIINFTLSVDPNNSRQLLIITNTYSQKDINTDKIYEKSYSTKPNNTGLGLWEVRKILNRNKNLNLFTSKTEKFFSQQLEIYI